MAFTPAEETSTPVRLEADEEILMWVHSGIQEAEQEAAQEGRPKSTTFPNEEVASIVPADPATEDEDTEEQRARLYLQEDLNQAVQGGFSIATEKSISIICDEVALVMTWETSR